MTVSRRDGRSRPPRRPLDDERPDVTGTAVPDEIARETTGSWLAPESPVPADPEAAEPSSRRQATARRTSRAGERRTHGPVRYRAGRQGLDLRLAAAVALVVVLALVAGVAAFTRGRSGSAASASTGKPAVKASVVGAGASEQSDAEASAVFAKMKKYGVEIHFPALPDEMLAVGFHQAWNTKATDILPTLKVHPKDKYAATKAALQADTSLKLFLMMSRGRGSSEYSAADCAVKPESILLSPVTGVVTLVKTYTLAGYGKDYQLEIKADGAPKVRFVMIHIKDLTVKAGDRVEGGVTPVATVRHLTLDNQVNRYLPWPADHTHVQINAVGYKLNGGN